MLILTGGFTSLSVHDNQLLEVKLDYRAVATLYELTTQEAIEQRFTVDPSGVIMRLNQYCPWKDHLYNLETEMGVEKPILYCLVSFARLHYSVELERLRGNKVRRYACPWKLELGNLG